MSRSTGHPDQFGRREPVNRTGQPGTASVPQPGAQHSTHGHAQPAYTGQPQPAQLNGAAPLRSQADLALNRLQEFGLVPADRAQPAPYRPPSEPQRTIPANFHAHWQQHPAAAVQPAPAAYTPQPYQQPQAAPQPAAYSYEPSPLGQPAAPGFQPSHFPSDARHGDYPGAQAGGFATRPAPAAPPARANPAWPNAGHAFGVEPAPRPAQPQAYASPASAPFAREPQRNAFGQPGAADFQPFEQRASASASLNGGFGAAEPSLADWSHPMAAGGLPSGGHDVHRGAAQPNGLNYGYATEAGGSLEAVADEQYADEYYDEPLPPKKSRWRKLALMAAAVVVCGTGGVWGYAKFISPAPSEDTPLIKSADAPVRARPLDAGGKQFDYRDSKVMGRLGDGTASSDSADPSGTRKVQTLTVSRDGSIAPPTVASPLPPAASDAPANEPPGVISVPGMTVVDGFGASGNAPMPPPAAPVSLNGGGGVVQKPLVRASADDMAGSETPSRKLVVTPTVKPASTPAKPVLISGREPNSDDAIRDRPSTRGLDRDADALSSNAARKSAEKPRRERLAALEEPGSASASDAAASESSVSAVSDGSAGYVAVLASVPRSDGSRMAALAQFANMQQQYGSVLQNKTPDVREANLGAKGSYHRLLVGPPGSREEASALCGELKSAGYKDCWVTAY